MRDIIKQLTEYDLGSDLDRYLLHVSNLSKRKYKNSMLVHLLNAAKACIPALWKQETPPMISLWITKITDIYDMENITATLQGNEEKFNKK